MGVTLYTNNATGQLASGITAAATVVPLVTGHGARFPTPTGGDVFYATLVNAALTYEIVKVTARSGDSLTVVRAQEGTAASAFSASDRIDARMTAGMLRELQTFALAAMPRAGGQFSGAVTSTSSIQATGFSGPLTGNVLGNLTGNVTGNVTGSSGSCTGNAATATLATTATTAVSANAINGSVVAPNNLTPGKPVWDSSGNVLLSGSLSSNTAITAGTSFIASGGTFFTANLNDFVIEKSGNLINIWYSISNGYKMEFNLGSGVVRFFGSNTPRAAINLTNGDMVISGTLTQTGTP